MKATPFRSSPAIARTRRAASTKSRFARFNFASARFANSPSERRRSSRRSRPRASSARAGRPDSARQHAQAAGRSLPSVQAQEQTLATIARERGLEPLAVEIYEARPEAENLTARAATFLSADKELHSVEEVLTGVGHLIAERFSENAELRGRLGASSSAAGRSFARRSSRRRLRRRRRETGVKSQGKLHPRQGAGRARLRPSRRGGSRKSGVRGRRRARRRFS